MSGSRSEPGQVVGGVVKRESPTWVVLPAAAVVLAVAVRTLGGSWAEVLVSVVTASGICILATWHTRAGARSQTVEAAVKRVEKRRRRAERRARRQ